MHPNAATMLNYHCCKSRIATYVTTTRCPWRQMPERYGHFTTCWRRLLCWQNERVWGQILTVLAEEATEDTPQMHPACEDGTEPASP
jgi:transposase